MRKVLLKIKNRVLLYFSIIFKLVPIKKKRYMFISFAGKTISCNPMAYYEYVCLNHRDFQKIWVYNGDDKPLGSDVIYVKNMSLKYYYYLYTSTVIINNYRIMHTFLKKRSQTYIETWHAILGIKKCEEEAVKALPSSYAALAKKDSKNIDFIISPNSEMTKFFKYHYWYSGIIYEIGSPRNDIYFTNSKEDLREKLRQNIGVANERVLLYAPTFGNEKNYLTENELLNVASHLQNVTKEMWIPIVRLHPSAKVELCNYNNIKDVSNVKNLQKLMMSIDLLITDYSSVMYESLFAGVPCILYCKNKDDYIHTQRDLKINVDNCGFFVCETIDCLNGLLTDKSLCYIVQKECEIKRKYNFVDSGNASKELDQIVERVKNEKIKKII